MCVIVHFSRTSRGENDWCADGYVTAYGGHFLAGAKIITRARAKRRELCTVLGTLPHMRLHLPRDSNGYAFAFPVYLPSWLACLDASRQKGSFVFGGASAIYHSTYTVQSSVVWTMNTVLANVRIASYNFL